MKQKNIEAIERIMEALAVGKKFSEALSDVYTKRNVAIVCDDEMLDVTIVQLGLSNRGLNSLARKDLRNVGSIIEYAKTESLLTVPGFGITSGVELLESILNVAWKRMNAEQKAEFLIDVVERNEDYIRG